MVLMALIKLQCLPLPGAQARRCSGLSCQAPFHLPVCHWCPEIKKAYVFLCSLFVYVNCMFSDTYLFVEVCQPVHAFQLIALKLAIENGGLRNVVTSLDGRVGQAVALPKAGPWHTSRMQRGTATVLRLLIKLPCLRHTQLETTHSTWRSWDWQSGM